MSDWKMRRFWTSADVVPEGADFAVKLDGRGIKTPAKATLVLPTEQMALAVAAEWNAQVEEIDPNTMPMTRSANAAIDKVTHQHAEVADMLAAYGDSDLVCYRAESPSELVARQTAAWDPLLDWLDGTLGARLQPRTGVMHVGQDPEALQRFSQYVHNLSAFQLTAFHDLVSLSGSLVIGLAATHQLQPAKSLWELSRIDELWQEEKWGEDEEATQSAKHKQDGFLHAHKFFFLS